MDLGLTPGELKFRDELRAWLKVNLPARISHSARTSESRSAYYQYLKDWQRKLYDGGYAGIAVETLLGECQAIIKPLNRIFRDVPGVSGSTILDNGRVALILDVSTLLREVVAEQARLCTE